jgi:hypothetical protein
MLLPIHSVAVPEFDVSGDSVVTLDLAVNPLSAVLICLRPLNNTATLAQFQSYKGICAALNRVSVLDRGESIVSMRGEDLAALNYFRHGIMPFQGQHDDTDNERRCVVLPILLGRHYLDDQSCYPARSRGELTLELDIDDADTGYDDMRISVETIEIPGAKPKEFERKVAMAQTFAATGDTLIDLNPGRHHRGVLLFGTTPFGGAAPAPSFGRIKLLMDNRETWFTASDFEVAQMLHSMRGIQPPAFDGHMHRVDATAAVATQPTLSGPFNIGAGIAGAVDVTAWHQYAFLDFDPTGDDTYGVDASNAKRLAIQATAETADAIRVIPIEVVKLAGGEPTR